MDVSGVAMDVLASVMDVPSLAMDVQIESMDVPNVLMDVFSLVMDVPIHVHKVWFTSISFSNTSKTVSI